MVVPGPQAVKVVLVIASVWQLSHAAVPIGIWIVGADDVPLASVPLWQDAQPVASSPAWFIGELGPQAVNVVFVIARVWQVSQAVMTVSGMWVVGDDDVPLANEPLWHEAQPVASSPAWFIGEFGPQAAKLFVIASVWQLSHAAVPIGMWDVGADFGPLAKVSL